MARAERRRGRSSERRYEHPIPARDEIQAHMEKAGGPLPLPALAAGFGIEAEQHQRALENRLKAMVRDGQLIRNRAGEYCLTTHLDLVTGTVQAHPDGYGFLIPDDDSEDLYLSAREMRPLWDGDRVAVRASKGKRGSREGHVVEILARGTTSIVGQFHRERGIDYVLEVGGSRSEVLIARGGAAGAAPGDIVKVEIVEHPTGRALAVGRVTEVLGRPDRPGIETDVAMLARAIPYEWPEPVLEAARELPAHVTPAAKREREDLRSLPLVTIDGATAKDFDDAVWAERLGEGWRLIVAIADVSHYVPPDTALDHEARARGTSVYFPDRVVPMLPEELSNGLCSLNPRVDRLCLCCEMRVSTRGQVTGSRFFTGVMRSAARLTYDEAWKLLQEPRPRGKHAELKGPLEELRGVYRAFARARRRRGALDFDLPETSIELDEQGQVRNVHPVERLLTHRLIEECMIAANVEAAKTLRKGRIPALYRVHEGPDGERVDELLLFLKTFGFRLPAPSKLGPRDLSRIIEQIAGRPEAELIETVILRSMTRAVYQPKNVGHFGLGLAAYTHFTSPIRRYPDLLVHRGIKWLLEHRSARGFDYSLADMEQLGERCSRAERRADEAVWEVEERLKCAYMKKRVGETFRVMVSSIVPFGLFVRVPEVNVDGLIHVTSLPRDYYHRDGAGSRLTGERSGTSYHLTQMLDVRLVNVNVEERKIDFVPVDASDEPAEAACAPRRGRQLRGR